MNLSLWAGTRIYILMTESVDGMLDAQAMIEQAGLDHQDYHIRTAAMKSRLDEYANVIDGISYQIGEAAKPLSAPLYSLVPTPLGEEPVIIAAWRCKGGMHAIASAIPLDHLEDACESVHAISDGGLVIAI